MFGSKLEVKKFEESILQYEAMPVVEGKILLYGHSLFTRCSPIRTVKENPDIEQELRMNDGSQAIVNHGFGTSSADDLLYYYSRMVRPYKPKALVLATAANDFGFGYFPKDVMDIQARLIDWFKADFPGAPVYCMNYLPNCKDNLQKIYLNARAQYNELLEDYCKKNDCTYIAMEKIPFLYSKAGDSDAYQLNPEDIGDYSKIKKIHYVGDQVHFNPAGYQKFIAWFRDFLDQEGLL